MTQPFGYLHLSVLFCDLTHQSPHLNLWNINQYVTVFSDNLPSALSLPSALFPVYFQIESLLSPQGGIGLV